MIVRSEMMHYKETMREWKSEVHLHRVNGKSDWTFSRGHVLGCVFRANETGNLESHDESERNG